MDKITEFDKEFAFLSNFFPAAVTFEGVMYPTVEHAFQAAKTTDQTLRSEFLACATPGAAKRKGRKITLRPDWERIKNTVMLTLVRDKFASHPDLKQKLLDTGHAELVEGTRWHDTYWGIDLETMQGQNHLGRILMQVRDELRLGRI